MSGAPTDSARSITLWIFSANTSPSAPPKTVKSCENTNTLRPSMVPQPVTTPSVSGRLFSMPKPWARWRASMSSSTNDPGSSSRSSRSRAVSLPGRAGARPPLGPAWSASSFSLPSCSRRSCRAAPASAIGAPSSSMPCREATLRARNGHSLDALDPRAERRLRAARTVLVPRTARPRLLVDDVVTAACTAARPWRRRRRIDRPGRDRPFGLRDDPELRPHLRERPIGVGEPVDRQQVATARVRAAQRTAAHRVGETRRHPFFRQVPTVVREQSGRARQVSGLEQADDHGEEAEPARVVVRARDEPEHLDSHSDRGAVVGQHVHPIVLREQRRRAAAADRGTRTRARRRTRDCPARASRRGSPLKRGPPRRELRVVAAHLPRLVERTRRVQLRGVRGVPRLHVAAALEVDEGEPEAAGRVTPRDRACSASSTPSSAAYGLDAFGDFGRQRHQHAARRAT